MTAEVVKPRSAKISARVRTSAASPASHPGPLRIRSLRWNQPYVAQLAGRDVEQLQELAAGSWPHSAGKDHLSVAIGQTDGTFANEPQIGRDSRADPVRYGLRTYRRGTVQDKSAEGCDALPPESGS